mmetsp:Transcript_31186/g.58531  ORF Transcript_31186/g.58531 Transcript_31186/m.58531 type:complete len:281 (+) Transcript_31186:84-926(+)
MCGAVDVSLCLSVALALLWQRGVELEAADAVSSRSALEQILLWRPIMALRSSNQVLPSILVVLAARSMSSVAYSGFTLGLHRDEEGWLGELPTFWERLAVQCAVLIWRTEKVETLMQRMMRSASVVKANGFGACVKNGFADPGEWMWPGFWGSFRRFALIAVSSVGYGSFVRATLPAVVFDECLWWVVSKGQDAFARKVCTLPMTLDVVILPALDILHMLPVIAKVFLVAITEYPLHAEYPVLLVVCAMAWTGHNCHLAWRNLTEIPEQMMQLWGSGAAT